MPLSYLGRKDWGKGEIAASGMAAHAFYVLFGLFWTVGLSWALVASLGRPDILLVLRGTGLTVSGILLSLLFALVFFLLGPLPLWVGAIQLTQLLRWGRAVLRLEINPVRVGGILQGKILIPAVIDGSECASLTLSCNSARSQILLIDGLWLPHPDRGYFDDPLWTDSKIVLAQEIMSDGQATTIPISIRIPDGLPKTTSTSDEPTSGTFWKLKLSVKRRGIAYRAHFTVPVL